MDIIKSTTPEQTSYLDTHPDSFVHLHLHTQYSLLDGAMKINEVMKKAKDFNMPAVAMTDHGNMFGAIEFYTEAKKNGIKPILGCEIYVTPGSRFEKIPPTRAKTASTQDAVESAHKIFHLILLCKNNIGYKNLCQIVSKAYLEGFYYKPRADYELLREHSEGLIATTACLSGSVGYHFLTDQDERARKDIETLKGIFGDDLYLEIMENKLKEQEYVNKKIIAAADDFKVKLVATNDAHYLTREDAMAQEVLLCIQTGKKLSDENRMKMSTDEFYFKPAEVIREQMPYAKEAIDNTLRIADQCNVELNWEDEEGRTIYQLPDFEIDTGETTDDYFRRVSLEGLEKRFVGPQFKNLVTQENWESELKPKYYERLEIEVGLILSMGFPGYFLIVSDFILWAKENGIPVGPGRGSGAGSLVAYSLDITNIDPLPFNLLFERFINPERISMPDFDVDFCQQRRGEVIDYVTRKYGADKVSQIITFGTLSAKAVIRDVARVFDIPYAEADMLAKLIPDELGIKLDKALELEPKLTELIESDPKVKQVFNISQRLEGLNRHAGIHAAGVIITNDPIVNFSPVSKGKEGEQVCQFDKNWSELIGLVKFDFLGLKTLTVIDNAVKFVKRDHDDKFDIEFIDVEDRNVYEFISKGETIGVFQLESSGMIDLCKRIRPDTLDDITAINALYRPGPLESGMVDDFIEIKHGQKDMTFAFDDLEPVLKDTYGVIVYQEQVMNIARMIAGYSLGQADMLRRAMGKKKVSEMDRHRKIFCDGALERGYDVDKARDLFELMANFAAYGFNKSHAVAYALIAYQTAFLKRYYPSAFFAALLSTELNNADKVTIYINDCKNYNIDVLPPDVNESLWHFNVVEENIRFGMGAIKNVGENAVVEIVREREENGPFESFVNFCQRVNLKMVNKRVIESLIKVGAFDLIEKFNRKTLLENLEFVVQYAQKKQADEAIGKISFFDEIEDVNPNGNDESFLEIEEIQDFGDKEKLDLEMQLLGIYVSGHPLDRFRNVMKQMSSIEISNIEDIPAPMVTGGGGEAKWNRNEQAKMRRELVLSGMVSSKKVILTKKGDKMSFLNFEDLSGKIECIVFPKVFSEYVEILNSDEPLILTGYTNLQESPRKFFPQKIHYLKDEAENRVTDVRIHVSLNDLSELRLKKFKETLLSYRGAVRASLIFENNNTKGRMVLPEDYLVNPTPQFAAKVNDIFQTNAVKFIVDGKLSNANAI